MNDLLKFITCGSVDDGKSTLIGHLLYDAKLIYANQKEALLLDSKVGSRGGAIDYSLLLDGLLAECEQGITIDVAYRYFTTDNRSFICADTPGHEEYTRNMACGASFAGLAVILVDATQGVLTQTRRHARICALMGIRYFVFAINKMDLVDYSEARFQEIRAQIEALQQELHLHDVKLIPVSATEGDNVTKKSSAMAWYDGPTLLDYLEQVDVSAVHEEGFDMAVPRGCRANLEFRGFEGGLERGSLAGGDTLPAQPSGEQAEVKKILVADHEAESAFKGQPVTIQLNREVDVSRGCVLEKGSHVRQAANFKAEILWMDDVPLSIGKNFMVFLGTKKIPGILTKIDYRIDINTGEHVEATGLKKNEIALCEIAVTEPSVLDTFDHHRKQGEHILIDRISNMTSACGVVREIPDGAEKRHFAANQQMRSALNWQAPLAIAFEPAKDGISLATVEEAEYYLVRNGRHTYLYHPSADEDPAPVLRHLLQAGLVVLLVLDKDQPLPEGVRTFSELSGKAAAESTSQQIAETILHHSMLDSMMAPNNWII